MTSNTLAVQRRHDAKRRRTPRRRYSTQRANAKGRGIPFLLTFDEWWSIWQASGHWDECGQGSGYAMCRYGDRGAYEVGNVSIIPGRDNSSETAKRIGFADMGRAAAERRRKFNEAARSSGMGEP